MAQEAVFAVVLKDAKQSRVFVELSEEEGIALLASAGFSDGEARRAFSVIRKTLIDKFIKRN